MHSLQQSLQQTIQQTIQQSMLRSIQQSIQQSFQSMNSWCEALEGRMQRLEERPQQRVSLHPSINREETIIQEEAANLASNGAGFAHQFEEGSTLNVHFHELEMPIEEKKQKKLAIDEMWTLPNKFS